VSEKYVQDTIDVLESKISREIENIKKKDIEKQQKLFNDAIGRISTLAKQNTEEFASLKGTISYLEGLIKKKTNPEELKSLANIVKDVKYGYERECETTMSHIHKMEDKIAEFNRRFIVVESFTKTVKDKNTVDLDSRKSENNGEYNAESSIKYKIIDDRVKNLSANFEGLKQELDKKADNSELVRIENTKVSKEELMSLLPSEESKDILKEEFKSEIAYFHKSIDDLRREWDLKLVRLRKEMDLFTIRKDINTRAKEEDVKGDIGQLAGKFNGLEQVVGRFSYDFESMKEFIKRVSKSIRDLQEINQNVLLGKQNIN
jgi:hypothetical protein